MNTLEKILKHISFILGTSIFTFLFWLLLIYNNFDKWISIFLGGLLIIVVLYFVFKKGYWFID